MNKKDEKYVKGVINSEGFEYAFVDYTDFEDEVKDAEFHKLRKTYLEARQNLVEYLKWEPE